MKNFLPGVRWLRSLGWVLGLAGLLLLGARPALAQIPTATSPVDINPAAPRVVRPDTATVRKPTKKERRALAAADSAKRTERLFGMHLTRPQKAGFLALVPGTGQIYNRKYWKLPIVYGMVGGLGYWFFYQQKYYTQYVGAKDTVNANISRNVDVFGTKFTNVQRIALLGNRAGQETSLANINTGLEFYRRYRDLSVLISALGYSLQILDAVVDAHLHDFDVSDDLSLHWEPALLPVAGQVVPAPGLTLTLSAK